MIVALGQTEEGSLLGAGFPGCILKVEVSVSVMMMILGLGSRHGLELYNSTRGLRLTEGERMT